ncbi:hypothetical protein AGMMS49579_01370 [Spirochaetia bacterium]|nr:hypothetical protein AGMMS49579_01370 [Spirochaetia bacterium]
MVNIIDLDFNIRQYLKSQLNMVSLYIHKLQNLNTIYLYPNLSNSIKQDLKKDEKTLKILIKNAFNYYFYDMDTYIILQQYTEILSTKIYINFIKEGCNNLNFEKINSKKQILINQFINICKQYVTTDFMLQLALIKPIKKDTLLLYSQNCSICKSNIIIKDDDNIITCLNCCNEIIKLNSTSLYNDNGKVNVTNKYTYDRKVHFKDCINQYQGKQNTNISPNIYSDIEQQLVKHRIISKHKNAKNRFSKVTKLHILFFLKELHYTKHYEDVILIHYNLTGQKPNNIEYLEDKLLEDFDQLTESYDKIYKGIDRKNFINTQYVLFQLLKRHNYPCKKEDFAILKTAERKSLHDEICKTLFNDLGWEYNFIL